MELLSELDVKIDLTGIISEWVYQVELGWNSENQFRNPKMLDIFFFIKTASQLSEKGEREEMEIE